MFSENCAYAKVLCAVRTVLKRTSDAPKSRCARVGSLVPLRIHANVPQDSICAYLYPGFIASGAKFESRGSYLSGVFVVNVNFSVPAARVPCDWTRTERRECLEGSVNFEGVVLLVAVVSVFGLTFSPSADFCRV